MTIAEVAKAYGLTPDTLRYYERVGLLPTVNRSRGGIRDYTESDCNWVGFIKCMRGAGLPIETLIEYVALFQKGDTTLEARKALLVEQRTLLETRIAEMNASLVKLNYKIEHYEQLMKDL
jgi:DNA-binding transcriptional MerR regulator